MQPCVFEYGLINSGLIGKTLRLLISVNRNYFADVALTSNPRKCNGSSFSGFSQQLDDFVSLPAKEPTDEATLEKTIQQLMIKSM